jgi:two-component system, sensor histidine kinase and response regulator
MVTQEPNRIFLEPPYRTPRPNVAERMDATRIPGFVRHESLEDLQHKQERLRLRTNELQARNSDLEAYAHMVAHDLKDPLAAIVITSELLTDIPDLNRQELREFLQQIKATAYDMNGIINNLLLFTEVSKAEAPVEPVEMGPVVGKVCKRLALLTKEYQARIDLPETWPVAIGYAPWIEEVWANYISNALKHGRKPVHIQLGATTLADGMLRFWIRDNGPGIPAKTQMHLFRPFVQVRQSQNSEKGMGLSIVRSIVEKLGGQVGVESKLGQGSLFFFTLPAP